jgi:4-hydroxybenzoate polyprenyltransferase
VEDIIETTSSSQTAGSLPHASLLSRVIIAMGDIKLAHSVFAMPFAVLGTFLAAPRTIESPHQIQWALMAKALPLVIACMIFARNWAMLINRVLDADIDADNPRTAKRAFASGRLARRDGYLMLAINAIAFMGCCALFGLLMENWWPMILGVPVLVWIGFYSLTKRFTWLCHVFLGGALAVSPIAAAIAINPDTLTLLFSDSIALVWISCMVLCWVAGFDIIYALQDLEYDREVGLSSIPARFGWKRAIWLSRLLHLLAVVCLFMALGSNDRLGVLFVIAIMLVALILIYEHVILAKRGRAGIPMAFFTLNGIVSLVLGTMGCIDVLV